MKKIFDYQIIDHGVENDQYFQGCGVSLTPFTDVATGIGGSARIALDDALDSLAQNDWETKPLEKELKIISDVIDVPEDAPDCYHYVSIRVREKADVEQ